jgi:hypothetical protein
MKTRLGHIVLPLLLATLYMAATSMNANACEHITIEILSPTNQTYSTNSIPLTFTVNRHTSWIGYSLDEQANVTICGNTTLTDLTDGTHCIVVYAKEECGPMGKSNTACFAVDTTPPDIANVTQSPPKDNVQPEDIVKVNATITDETSGVKQATLNYTTDNATWTAVEMTNIEDNIWNATIPAFPQGTNVTYTITAEDNAGNTANTEETGYTCHYTVIPEFASLAVIPFSIVTTLTAITIRKRKHP